MSTAEAKQTPEPLGYLSIRSPHSGGAGTNAYAAGCLEVWSPDNILIGTIPVETLIALADIPDPAGELADVRAALGKLHAYLSGIMEYEHGVMNDEGETPRMVMEAALARLPKEGSGE